MFVIYSSIFFLGASLASFINATLYRIDNKKEFKNNWRTIARRNSYCENCKKELNWIELFPIVGYLIYGGKCSKCRKSINIYYPISEFILGVSTLLFYLNSVPFYLYIILIFLFILSYYDYIYKAVPKSLVHVFLGISILFFIVFNFSLITLVIVLSLAISLLILSALMKKSFGLGDVLILIGLGIVMSYKSFLVMFWIGILLALLCSIVYSILKKRDLRKIKIPMIPFFTISFLITCIYGLHIYDLLTNWLST